MIAMAALMGCSREAPHAPSAQPATSTPQSLAKPPELKPVVAEAGQQGPDVAFDAMLQAIEEARPEAIFDALPRSFQRELDIAFREAAAEIDAASWTALLDSARRTLRGLRESKVYVLGNPLLRDSPLLKREHLEKHWTEILDLAGAFLDDEALDLPALTTGGVRPFLSGPCAQFLRRLAALSRSVEGDPWTEWTARQKLLKRVVAGEGTEAAVVRWESDDPKVAPREERWVRVEGRWIPELWKDRWPSTMEHLRSTLVPQPLRRDASAAEKQRWIDRLSAWNRAIERLAAARSQEQFDSLVSQESAAFLARSPAPPAAGAALQSVFVVVPQRLDGPGRDAWQERLGNLADDPQLAIVIPALDGDATRFEVNPVADPQAFAARLKFAKIAKIDADKRELILAALPAE